MANMRYRRPFEMTNQTIRRVSRWAGSTADICKKTDVGSDLAKAMSSLESVIRGSRVARYGRRKRLGIIRMARMLAIQTPMAAQAPHGGSSGVGVCVIMASAATGERGVKRSS